MSHPWFKKIVRKGWSAFCSAHAQTKNIYKKRSVSRWLVNRSISLLICSKCPHVVSQSCVTLTHRHTQTQTHTHTHTHTHTYSNTNIQCCDPISTASANRMSLCVCVCVCVCVHLLYMTLTLYPVFSLMCICLRCCVSICVCICVSMCNDFNVLHKEIMLCNLVFSFLKTRPNSRVLLCACKQKCACVRVSVPSTL